MARGVRAAGVVACFCWATSASAEPTASLPSAEPEPAAPAAERAQPAVVPPQQPPAPPASIPTQPYYYRPIDDTAPSQPPAESRWYGWQTLALDGGALALVVFGLNQDAENEEIAYLGLLAYVFGGPGVHLAHERPGAMLGSFGMRVGAPLLGAGIGAASADCSARGDFCGVGEVAAGFLLGAGAAIAIDAAVLARETRHEPVAERPRLTPRIAITPERRALVLSGTF
jgi:hypothetical protein